MTQAKVLRQNAGHCRQLAKSLLDKEPGFEFNESAYQGALLRAALYDVGAAIVATLEGIKTNQRRPR